MDRQGEIVIVTHSGTSHVDEIAAIGMIALHERGKHCANTGWFSRGNLHIVHVPDGHAADLTVKHHAKYVVDVGREHVPERGWFDHHQFPASHPPCCALTLVAEHLFPIMYRNESVIPTVKDFQWMEKMAVLDSKGPYGWFERQFGRRAASMKEAMDALGGDSIANLLTRIANSEPDNRCFTEAVEIAERWMDLEFQHFKTKTEKIQAALGRYEIILLDDRGDDLMLFFNQKDMQGVTDACDRIDRVDLAPFTGEKVVVGLLDERGDGYAAFRLNDCQRVNFLPRKGEKGCVFAHENGFVLKWEKNWPGFVDAVQRSVCPKPVQPV